MKRHVVDVAAGHARASAAPDVSAVLRFKPRTARAPFSATEASPAIVAPAAPAAPALPLREQQLWFAEAVMTPESGAPAVDDAEAERVLTSGPRLGALDRLEIYRRGYHARLVECLADDYPAMQHALGHDAFEALCRGYVARHPSTSPSLNAYGRKMADFCRSEARWTAAAPASFAADLAALEWAIVDVIHAPSSEPLTLEGLGDVPMEAWASARLVPNAAFRLLRFEYPVNAYFQSFREGAAPAVPEAAGSATVVYRSGPTIWRMDLTVPMFDVLSTLVAGGGLEESLERAVASLGAIDEAEAGQRIMMWFREWVSGGLFARIELG